METGSALVEKVNGLLAMVSVSVLEVEIGQMEADDGQGIVEETLLVQLEISFEVEVEMEEVFDGGRNPSAVLVQHCQNH